MPLGTGKFKIVSYDEKAITLEKRRILEHRRKQCSRKDKHKYIPNYR